MKGAVRPDAFDAHRILEVVEGLLVPGNDIRIGAAVSCGYPVAPDHTDETLHEMAAQGALDDAGLTWNDIDGFACVTQDWLRMPSIYIAESLGIRPTWTDTTSIGGASFVAHVLRAREAIAAGSARRVLITYGSTIYSRSGRALGTQGTPPSQLAERLEGSVGLNTVSAYALAASAHAHRYGTTAEDLARIAVATREWAGFNEHAMYRDPITVDDVLASPVVSSPLHRLDCCVVSDGAGAVIVAADRDLPDDPSRPRVWIRGGAEELGTQHIASMCDLTESPAAGASRRAFAESGLGPKDMSLAMLYDSFTITALLQLEDCGFVGKGRIRELLDRGIGPGGEVPVNVDGGGLSAVHPGMRGIFLIVEAVKQLRQEGTGKQVPNAVSAFVNGIGGWLSSAASLVLSVEKS